MQTWIWALPLIAVAFLLWQRRAIGSHNMKDLLANGAVIVDVRTPAEFAGGHPKAAVNIPLDQLEARAAEIARDKPVLLCCASGGRSARATSYLKGLGYDAHNAGPWTNLAS